MARAPKKLARRAISKSRDKAEVETECPKVVRRLGLCVLLLAVPLFFMAYELNIILRPQSEYNKQWVLSRNCIDGVQSTFEYVKRNHKGFGVEPEAWHTPMDQLSVMPIARLSNFADAVTRLCYVEMGEANPLEDAKINFDMLNPTSIGNVAFLATHHPNAEIRKYQSDWLRRWRFSYNIPSFLNFLY
jgi:hypothetical protein